MSSPLSRAIFEASERSLNELAVAEELGELNDDYVMCNKVMPRRDGMKAALLFIGTPERVRQAFETLMGDAPSDEEE